VSGHPEPAAEAPVIPHTLTEYGTTNCPVEGVRAEVDEDGCSACGAPVPAEATVTLTESERASVCICPWDGPIVPEDAHSLFCSQHREAVESIARRVAAPPSETDIAAVTGVELNCDVMTADYPTTLAAVEAAVEAWDPTTGTIALTNAIWAAVGGEGLREEVRAALVKVDRTWGGAAMVVKDTVLSILGEHCTNEFCEHDHAAMRRLRSSAADPGAGEAS
jgi:hypothetical protein